MHSVKVNLDRDQRLDVEHTCVSNQGTRGNSASTSRKAIWLLDSSVAFYIGRWTIGRAQQEHVDPLNLRISAERILWSRRIEKLLDTEPMRYEPVCVQDVDFLVSGKHKNER